MSDDRILDNLHDVGGLLNEGLPSSQLLTNGELELMDATEGEQINWFFV